jgi:hypothetical protein
MRNIYTKLLLLIAGATQKELARQVQYLKVEVQILRGKLPGRVPVTPQERNPAGPIRCQARPGDPRDRLDRSSADAAAL